MNVLECPLCRCQFEKPTKTVALRSHTRVDFYWCQNPRCGLMYFQVVYTSILVQVEYPCTPCALSRESSGSAFQYNIDLVTKNLEKQVPPELAVPWDFKTLKIEGRPLKKGELN